MLRLIQIREFNDFIQPEYKYIIQILDTLKAGSFVGLEREYPT
jgi:hypothetical protein